MIQYLKTRPWWNIAFATQALALGAMMTSQVMVVPAIEIALTIGISGLYIAAAYTLYSVGRAIWNHFYPKPIGANLPATPTFENGIEIGYEEGLREGYEEGLREGREAGLRDGHEAGRKVGICEGRVAGLRAGRVAGLCAGREAGLREGYEAGYREGYAAGLQEGLQQVSKPSNEPEQTSHSGEENIDNNHEPHDNHPHDFDVAPPVDVVDVVAPTAPVVIVQGPARHARHKALPAWQEQDDGLGSKANSAGERRSCRLDNQPRKNYRY